MEQEILEFAQCLINCKNEKIIYIKTNPEIIDITDKNFSFFIEVLWKNKLCKIGINKNNFYLIHSLLKESIFKNKTKIICYNFKNYCSIYKCLANKDIELECSIFDLKVISGLLGQKINQPPESFKQAYIHLKEILENNWDKIKKIYSNIYLPLITNVIPGLENSSLIDIRDKKIKKSYYEIEAQENSRLSTYGYFLNSFLPMNLKKEDKESYIPLNQEQIFLYFDYKNMEVSILEYLTKDPNLTKILSNYNDFYEGLYKELINPNDFDKDKRKKIKNIFLPYVYGASDCLISDKCNIKIDIVKEIIKRIKETFKKTFLWLENYSNSCGEDHIYKNKFGKLRKIEEKYKSINFIVQSTASIFCLDKLIDIYNIFDGNYISFYIHDGYGFVVNQKDYKNKIKIIKNILIEENSNFENIILNTSCTYGRNLNNMLEYNFQET